MMTRSKIATTTRLGKTIGMRKFAFIGALALLPMASPVGAQTYPSRPITLLIPFPAGSATDVVARRLAESIKQATNAVVVVENKPGADGNLAAVAVLRAEPDGYTVFVTTNSTHSAN